VVLASSKLSFSRNSADRSGLSMVAVLLRMTGALADLESASNMVLGEIYLHSTVLHQD